MKKLQKSKRQFVILLGLGAGIALWGLINMAEQLFKIFSDTATIESSTPLSDFLRGFATGLNFTGFLLILIIIVNLYLRNNKGEKLFSPPLIRHVTAFGATQVAASLAMTIGMGFRAGYGERYQIAVGLLIIIFAQVFRRALRMQQEEELTI